MDTKFSFVFVQTLKRPKAKFVKKKLACGKGQPYEHRLGQFRVRLFSIMKTRRSKSVYSGLATNMRIGR